MSDFPSRFPARTNEYLNMAQQIRFGLVRLVLALPALLVSAAASGQPGGVTFHRDIEPILQKSCQNCHRVGGVGPMPLVTYEQAPDT